MDRIGEMTAFTKVVETGSFVGAARQLRLSPTMISKQVRELEERLGAKLLHRTTRQVSLTEVGSLFYERCSGLLAELNEVESAASQLQTTPRGVLRVSAPLAFGSLRIPAMLPAFAHQYPDVTIELTLVDRTVDLVEEGIDVAVVIGDIPNSSTMTRLLGMTRIVACASPAYLARKGTPQTPDDLANHNCLIHTVPVMPRGWAFVAPDGRPHVVKMAGNFLTNSVTALLTAAVAGQGVILTPSYLVAKAVKSGRLVTLLGGYTAPEIPIRLVYPPGRYPSAKVRAFIDFLVSRMAAEEL
ncbi:LysR family transcriptional regulator [Rhodopila globiformis]|uniref:HTH lysR-type domain-containing protein n=1 Tax=Rhodopila globiformis TaxID=1071 RepID=A0A2S6NK46_RHOGL|nr:LysR family transcriptional regulator [Rhodopila globiformis]PPQ35311.1 hypothetical protein CCS01_08180 [Rhodopila globiformis]